MVAGALLLAPAAQAAPVERLVEIDGPLKGVMLAPEGGSKAPAVVILPGSGPTDRDGNNPLGVRGSTYRLLAEGLAAEGVASLRMDKRGMFASAGAARDPNKVTVVDLAADANAWAAKLKAETGAKCVWLLGHSEGGLVALIAAQHGRGLCGLVLVSTSGRPLGEVLRDQLKANPANAPVLPQALKAIDELEAGRKVDTAGMPPALSPLFNPAVQDFLIVMFKQDPARLVSAYKGPVLAVAGTTDLQVTVEDSRRLQAARPSVKLVTIEGVNHVLKAAPADRRANLATYADPSLPIAPGVVEAIAAFVKAQSGS
ncbi:alpha/beta hydrolase [Caulobacter mirabilis]|uniref:Alpha/beta hydrolase n=1 Tax=Caulobacter mirabilis TaxID=69666 RepID=A0A2D2B3W6_9CAUL|nr:alpha/beta hydrolase [Caulobacter mirabilis]